MPIHTKGYCPYNVATEAYNTSGPYRVLSNNLTYAPAQRAPRREPRVLAAIPCHVSAHLRFAGAHNGRCGIGRHERRELQAPSPVAVHREARQVRRRHARIQAFDSGDSLTSTAHRSLHRGNQRPTPVPGRGSSAAMWRYRWRRCGASAPR